MEMAKTAAPVIVKPRSKKPMNGFEQGALDRHNYFRSMHGVPPLEWCQKCAQQAQKHASFLAKTGLSAHSKAKGFGESLRHWKNNSAEDITAQPTIDSWYEEVNLMKDFSDPTPSNWFEVSHFTQMVWKATTHMGMAYAVNGHNLYVVANYLPPGNLRGLYADNVLPPNQLSVFPYPFKP